MSIPSSSSAQQARRALASRLAELKEDAGLSGRELAERCGWHPSKSSRIENARTAPSASDIHAWCSACGAAEQTADLIATLRIAEGMWVGWRRMEAGGLKHAQRARGPLFERTRQFRAYSSWMVPGLLQTRRYTEVVLRAVQRRRVAVDDVEEAVAARMQRQSVLGEGWRTFVFLVEESVLHNGLGGRNVQAEQLDRLAEASGIANVAFGVVPMSAERSRMPVEGFWIFDDAQVNAELVSGHLTVTQPGEVAMYARTFGELSDQAVYGCEAQTLIERARRVLR